MKKILVASFQRSGTHFLINNFATNFENVHDNWVDLVHTSDCPWARNANAENLSEKMRSQLLETYLPSPWRRCVKTHHQAYRLERHMDAILEHYNIFYIMRDPRDVMVACYHFFNRTNFEQLVKEKNFSKFLRAKLWDAPAETHSLSFSHAKPRDIVDKWNKHVLSWLPWFTRGVHLIRYEDLNTNLDATLRAISANSTQRLKSTIKPVTLDDPRFRPDHDAPNIGRGKSGVWRDWFSLDDLHFLKASLSTDVQHLAFAGD